MKTDYTSVDEYIAKAPEAAQQYLRQVRRIIKEVAPGAQEKLSYQMPYYSYKGRLIYYAGHSDYVGLYVMSGARESLKEQIAPYLSGKATLKFYLDKPLPKELIKKIILVQAAANERHEM